MKVAHDWEFLERGSELGIMPISVGMVREDGERLYLINGEMALANVIRHPWLSMNVVPYLPLLVHGHHGSDYTGAVVEWDPAHQDYQFRVGLDEMRFRIREFLDVPELELWTYYGAFDHVVLTQLFGTMADYPPGLPMYSRDVMQEWDRLGSKVLMPQQAVLPHHALHDAQWIMDALKAIEFTETVGEEPAMDLGYLSLPREAQEAFEEFAVSPEEEKRD